MRVELPCGTHRFRCALYGHTQPNRNDINGVILSWARFRRYAASPKIQPATQPTSYIEKALDFRTSGALSSFAWSCRGNGGGRVRAPVGACKKINNLRPSYRHTGVAIGTSAKTHKKSTEHGACLLRGQCSRASIPRLSLAAMKSSLVELMAPLCGSLGAARRPPGSAQRKKQRYGKIPL